MGSLCSCLCPKEDTEETKARTPLLSGNRLPQTTGTNNAVSGVPGQSARLHRPTEARKELTSSLDALCPVNVGKIGSVSSLDKTFQDHVRLYNDLYSVFVDLRKCLHVFKAKFESETAGIPTIAECLRLLAERCGDDKLQGSRTKNCIEIIYDKRTVSEKCQSAEDVMETIELYNKINRHMKTILARAPQVKSSITLILEEEEKLKKEIIKADPDGKLGPDPLRVTNENFAKLHKLPGNIDTIEKYTKKTFKEIANGSKILFRNT